MQTSVDIENLSREEKLQLMHAIWENLVKDEKQIKSPEWHEGVLRETEELFRSGKEHEIDWSDAKEELRKRFNNFFLPFRRFQFPAQWPRSGFQPFHCFPEFSPGGGILKSIHQRCRFPHSQQQVSYYHQM